jgi:ABC-2 type transport system ATP-binding protein
MDVDGAHVIARGITARGPEGIAFENVDLRVGPGSLAVVVGASGTGRTSLLLALSGRLHLATGYLEVSGYMAPEEVKAIRRLMAPARIRPGFELEPRQRVRDTMTERRVISGVSREAIDEAFALVGIDPDRLALVGELHPGEQLLLAVALAAATAPAGLLVDDVDAGLPLAARTRVWAGLRAVTWTGTTVFATSTDPPFDDDALVLRLPYEPEIDDPTDELMIFDEEPDDEPDDDLATEAAADGQTEPNYR